MEFCEKQTVLGIPTEIMGAEQRKPFVDQLQQLHFEFDDRIEAINILNWRVKDGCLRAANRIATRHLREHFHPVRNTIINDP